MADTLGEGFAAQALRTAMDADRLAAENARLRALLREEVLPWVEKTQTRLSVGPERRS